MLLLFFRVENYQIILEPQMQRFISTKSESGKLYDYKIRSQLNIIYLHAFPFLFHGGVKWLSSDDNEIIPGPMGLHFFGVYGTSCLCCIRRLFYETPLINPLIDLIFSYLDSSPFIRHDLACRAVTTASLDNDKLSFGEPLDAFVSPFTPLVITGRKGDTMAQEILEEHWQNFRRFFGESHDLIKLYIELKQVKIELAFKQAKKPKVSDVLNELDAERKGVRHNRLQNKFIDDSGYIRGVRLCYDPDLLPRLKSMQKNYLESISREVSFVDEYQSSEELEEEEDEGEDTEADLNIWEEKMDEKTPTMEGKEFQKKDQVIKKKFIVIEDETDIAESEENLSSQNDKKEEDTNEEQEKEEDEDGIPSLSQRRRLRSYRERDEEEMKKKKRKKIISDDEENTGKDSVNSDFALSDEQQQQKNDDEEDEIKITKKKES